MIDATIVRAHQHAAGAKGGFKTRRSAVARRPEHQNSYRRRGIGCPLRMILTAGQVHEVTQASALIDGFTLISLIADKGFDNDTFRSDLSAAEVDVVIPPLGSRTAEIAYDENAYGLRYRIECFINKIKHYRRIVTRFEKTARNFFSMLVPRGRYDLASRA
jgi:transposase